MNRSNGFIDDCYSDFASLEVFLATLSYHRRGSSYFGQCLAAEVPRDGWTLLDVGCGDGQFAESLLSELAAYDRLPAAILGLDPDENSLRMYEKRISRFESIAVQGVVGRVESLPPGQWTCVLASHSLYNLLENPSVESETKDQILRSLVEATAHGGLLLASMASRSSQAYRLKAQVLRCLGRRDPSAFGEELGALFGRIEGAQVIHLEIDSYMDVTGLLSGPASDVRAWIRYFCRLPDSLTSTMSVSEVRQSIQRFAQPFSQLPSELRTEYTTFEAACGAPGPNTMVLPHRELLIALST